MLKKKLQVYFLLISLVVMGQNNQQWQGYFSYNKITDLSATSNQIYAASENAFFSKEINSNDITTTNSIDGLKADNITAIYRSEIYNVTLVGNKNGLLFVVKNDGSIIQKRGIIDEVPVSPLIKKINHFLEDNGKIYISCDYGISVFDLPTLEFVNTYYMGPSGSYVAVQQTAINNGFIYAATKGNPAGSGIRKATLSNPFLDDYNQWIDVSGNEWNGLISFGTNIYAITNAVSLLKYDGTSATYLLSYPEALIDIRSNGNYFTITSPNHVYIYNQAIQLVAHIQSNQVPDSATFTFATVINDIIYIGTNEKGLLTSSLSNPTNFDIIKPDGPEKNYIFRVKKSTSTLWALYGKYNRTYNPYNLEPPYDGPFKYPLSKYTPENGWDVIPYSDLFGAKALSSLAFNPNNDNDFYVSSYFSGLLKMVNEVPTVLYNETNSGSDGLEEAPPPNTGIRVNGPVFDKNGNLWMTNNMVQKGLKVLKSNGSWQSFDLSSVIPESTDESYGVLAVDKNGTKWLPSSRNGLIAFNDQLSNKSIVINTGTEGNLPDTDVRCLAVDNRNQLWIGTAKGLRIVQNVDQFVSDSEIQTKAIIIEEQIDGQLLAQELFYDQFILDITVDGANRKWVAIADAGVFLVSSNGQQTVYHFTKDNSPLPSNNVNDIEIDGLTGEVYFATDKGMVSFKGTATKPSDDLSNVYVYPNPVRPEFSGTVKISGLTDKANVKITDIEGNLVYETTSAGGTIEWDTSAFGKYRVASGVYMVFVAAQDGIDTKVKKVMIIR